jgi:hypothetical protein
MKQTKKQKILALLEQNPNIKPTEIAKRVKCGLSTIYAVKVGAANPSVENVVAQQDTMPKVSVQQACEILYSVTKSNTKLCVTFDSVVEGIEILHGDELYEVPLKDFVKVLTSIQHITTFRRNFNGE